jgi:hypothetical protein
MGQDKGAMPNMTSEKWMFFTCDLQLETTLQK